MRHIVLLLAWPLVALPQTSGPDTFATIEGRVINIVTGKPIAKASVRLMRTGVNQTDSDWAASYSTSSDSTGGYAIRNIEPGKYRLSVVRNGFVRFDYGARSSRVAGRVLDLGKPEHLKDFEIRLTPHGVIAGSIFDVDSEPLEGVQIQLLRSQYSKGRKVLSTTRTAYTNDLGAYRFSGLTPGKYYVYAENFDVAPSLSESREEYVPVYYPGAENAGSAAPLDVAAGAEFRAADMMLRKERTAILKGRVAVRLPGATGAPTVTAYRSVGHNNEAAGSLRFLSAKVTSAGQFEIRTVTPGTYDVMAQIGRAGLSYASVAVPVTVAGGNIDDLILTIDSGVTLTGRIRLEGSAALDFSKLHVKVLRGGTEAMYQFKMVQDHTFRIEDLQPGRYEIAISGLPDGFYAKSIHVGDAEITYSELDVTAGAPGQLDILVSPKAGLVSGIVQNPKTNQPAPGAIVALVPADSERLKMFTSYRHATTGQNGSFTFMSVAPGEYKIYAWEEIEPTAWMDPAFMKPLEGKGESVTVGENAQVAAKVNLIPLDPEEKQLDNHP